MKAISVAEMRELDRRTIEDFGIPSIVLMENAGRRVSDVAMEMLKARTGSRAAIFCGTGNNGGDGFVAARYLARQGIVAEVYITGESSRVKDDPLINLNILRKMGVVVKEISDGREVTGDLIIDSMLGIGVKGEVKEPVRSVIADLNKRNIPVLSVDVPSGLDADTGKILGEAVKAKTTVTMQFPKKGFYVSEGPERAGEILVVDIGILE
ncbi:MAG: NAD(P)H-hydrate epimerase [Candidatus Omnitrophica bacterium]|nr:NAD(P)H-hydrate epimerase [Candidatus Omnitrophota bacterium]